MSKTFLTGVNDVLERAGTLGSSGTLSSFTDSGRQVYIDLAKQLWNETVDIVAAMTEDPLPGETASSSITLVLNTQEYALPSDLVQIRWPLVDQTNGYYINEYPGGYEQMRADQPIPGNYIGVPLWAVINPTTGLLRMDRTPDSSAAGLIYNLLYDKDLAMSSVTDVFPFSDATYRALVPAVTEGWEAQKRNDFNPTEYRKSLARALQFAGKGQRRTHW